MSIRKIALTASLALLICIALGIGCAQETGNYDGPVVGQVTGQSGGDGGTPLPVWMWAIIQLKRSF